MGLTFVAGPVRVRTPATSANLGPGFDALGLALALYDDARRRVVATGGVGSTVTGEGAGELPDRREHLVVRAMRATFDALGGQPPGLARGVRQPDPAGPRAGLVVGGDRGRRAVGPGAGRRRRRGCSTTRARCASPPARGPPGQRGALPARRLHDRLDRATGARAVSLPPADGVRPTVFVPAERGLTAQARAALPATVPHPDAALNAGRAALLVHALTARPDAAAAGDRRPAAPGLPRARGCRDRRRWSARCVRPVWRLWSVGRGRPCWR